MLFIILQYYTLIQICRTASLYAVFVPIRKKEPHPSDKGTPLSGQWPVTGVQVGLTLAHLCCIQPL